MNGGISVQEFPGGAVDVIDAAPQQDAFNFLSQQSPSGGCPLNSLMGV